MSKIIKLGMLFDESSAPDFGDIVRSASGELALTSSSLSKLTDNLTAAVCGAAFNVSAGTQAWVIDTGDVLAYHPDAWHYVSRRKRSGERYGVLTVEIKDGNAGYVLGDNERIVLSVVSEATVVISKELTLVHFRGNGVYGYRLNLEDAHKLYDLSGSDYTITAEVYREQTDITGSLTIEDTYASEWYDLHIKYDTGV